MIPLLSVQQVSHSFSGKPLFNELSLVIGEGERTALIGPNGGGKSTLIKVLARQFEPDSGTIALRSGLHVGYVAQEDQFVDELSVYETLSQIVPFSDPQREGMIAQALGKASFHDPEQLVRHLSGGWRKRLAIARALVCDPDILLLDEPTNHLDIQGILWLEKLLQGSRAALLFVSHDRYFIENVATRVIELDPRYPGGYLSVYGRYSDFVDTRTEFLAQRLQVQASLANKVRREVQWLRQGAKARTTKSKHRSEEALRMLAELKGMAYQERSAELAFAASGRKSKELLKAENISKAFGPKRLFSDLSFVISPGVRLGVVGANGSGKSTFLKTLLGEQSPDHGRILRAKGISCAFFEQGRKNLNKEETLQKALCREGNSVVFNGREIHVSSWAKRFLFSTDQLKVPLSALSGGEQARVLLARIMLEPVDILLLDEPTNDLDIATLEVLEESLDEFPGAVVLITHDRYLLDRVATHVLGLSGQGQSLLYASYTQWELASEQQLAREESEGVGGAGQIEGVNSRGEFATKFTPAEHKDWSTIEKRIAQAELEVQRLEQSTREPGNAEDANALTALCAELAKAQEKLDLLYQRWEELATLQEGFSK